GEEWGFLGSFVLLSLYGLVLVMMLVMAWRAEMRFARLAIAGIGVVFMLYVLVNVGMVSGLAPVVGVPLPLVSYGGTAMITLFAAFGIALSCASSRQVPPD
ncbi:MAG: FtsW/RodA/SpoVE family cell cycle protein, partial [Pseudomonadota bacterium]